MGLFYKIFRTYGANKFLHIFFAINILCLWHRKANQCLTTAHVTPHRKADQCLTTGTCNTIQTCHPDMLSLTGLYANIICPVRDRIFVAFTIPQIKCPTGIKYLEYKIQNKNHLFM